METENLCLNLKKLTNMHLIWKIAVGEYVFRYKIYPSANLVLKYLVLKYDITGTKFL